MNGVKIKLKLLRTLFVELINNIDAGNSNVDEDELNEAIEVMTTLNKGIYRISKAEACKEILHCSERTFERYVALGIIPKGCKQAHFKELSWRRKDFDEAIKYMNKEQS